MSKLITKPVQSAIAKAMQASNEAKQAAPVQVATTESKMAQKPIAQATVALGKHQQKLFYFAMGTGDGVSLRGRIFFFLLYTLQGAMGSPIKCDVRTGKPFRLYPGASRYYRSIGVWEDSKDASLPGLLAFTVKGANVLDPVKYAVLPEYQKQIDAIKTFLLTGKNSKADTGFSDGEIGGSFTAYKP